MPLEADLGILTIKRNQEVVKTNDLADKQAVFKEAGKTEELQTKFLESNAGIKIRQALEDIKTEALSAEDKKKKLVALMQDFFSVEKGDDESIQYLVDIEGKKWLRINSGTEIFDISLEWKDIKWLINWLISRYLEWAASVVNGDESDMEKKITLKYDADKLALEEIEGDLSALETEVALWVRWNWLRSTVTSKWNSFWKWAWTTFDEVKSATRDRVSSKFTMATSIIGSMTWVSTLMAAKDQAKAEESKKKWYDFSAQLDWFKNTLASAFGVWWTTTPSTPSANPPANPPEWTLT